LVLLITYDLRVPGKNYTGLYDEIKKAGMWWHHLDSTWLIKTNLTPSQWYNQLNKYIDKNDGLLIIQVTSNYQGWLPEKAWNWIRDQFSYDLG